MKVTCNCVHVYNATASTKIIGWHSGYAVILVHYILTADSADAQCSVNEAAE